MARVIALSSMVARGHVGLAAIVPALQELGHEVIALPTVVLSNHLGHARWAGLRVPAETLVAMLDALEANGWLGEVDGVLSGYLPSAAHVRFAASLITRVRQHRPDVRFFCDPVIGDDPNGLYVDEQIATALRDELLPQAECATPNRFELAWLTGKPVHDAASAVQAARALDTPTTLTTSVPAGGGRLANVLVTRDGAFQCVVPRQADVPHGTGDLIAALFAGQSLAGGREADHLARAIAIAKCVIEASHGRDELDIIASRKAWLHTPPLAVEAL